jgi:hypothetical protein
MSVGNDLGTVDVTAVLIEARISRISRIFRRHIDAIFLEDPVKCLSRQLGPKFQRYHAGQFSCDVRIDISLAREYSL